MRDRSAQREFAALAALLMVAVAAAGCTSVSSKAPLSAATSVEHAAPAAPATADHAAAAYEPPAAAPVAATDAPPLPADDPPPQGRKLTPEELQELAALFDDAPLIGGQVQPRVAKWLGEDVFLFLQFDTALPGTATELRYLGLGLRSRFCQETQPDAQGGSWPHFHRWVSPTYGHGHGTIPGAEGFWLTWLGVLPSGPGVQYGFFPTPPPRCVARQELPGVQPPGGAATGEELAALAALFADAPFAGGQASPYVAKWVNAEAFLFLDIGEDADALRYAGMGLRGRFCADAQPTPDFPHFRRWSAPSWEEGRGGAAGAWGYWMARLGTGAAESGSVGIDRGFDPTPPPACGA